MGHIRHRAIRCCQSLQHLSSWISTTSRQESEEIVQAACECMHIRHKQHHARPLHATLLPSRRDFFVYAAPQAISSHVTSIRDVNAPSGPSAQPAHHGSAPVAVPGRSHGFQGTSSTWGPGPKSPGRYSGESASDEHAQEVAVAAQKCAGFADGASLVDICTKKSFDDCDLCGAQTTRSSDADRHLQRYKEQNRVSQRRYRQRQKVRITQLRHGTLLTPECGQARSPPTDRSR